MILGILSILFIQYINTLYLSIILGYMYTFGPYCRVDNAVKYLDICPGYLVPFYFVPQFHP